MQLEDLIDMADRAYHNGAIGQEFRGHNSGDRLASFVLGEIIESFDIDGSDLSQRAAAAVLLHRAADQILHVALAIEGA